MLNEPPNKEKIFQLISSPHGLSLKLQFCHFKVNSSHSNVRQQTEHLLHEYKLNDKTLQKSQLKQHKIFQNFLTSPALAAPNAPPLPRGATPKVSPLLEPNESYANFLARLETAISCTVIGEETKKQLEKLLAYENANQKCQRAITAIRETGTITGYLKACHNLGSKTGKMQILAETMATTFKKGNEGCFTCGDKNHLKRDCPKKVNKNLQEFALTAVEECIGPKTKSKFDIEGKPIPENSKQGTSPPMSPTTKTRGKFYLSPQTLNIWQHCRQYTSPK